MGLGSGGLASTHSDAGKISIETSSKQQNQQGRYISVILVTETRHVHDNNHKVTAILEFSCTIKMTTETSIIKATRPKEVEMMPPNLSSTSCDLT